MLSYINFDPLIELQICTSYLGWIKIYIFAISFMQFLSPLFYRNIGSINILIRRI